MSDPTGLASDITQVTGDLPCAGCGYNLRTLAWDGVCPECGTAVREAVRLPLGYGSYAALRRARIGVLILAVSLLFWAVAEICREFEPLGIRLTQNLYPLWRLRPALLNAGLCAAVWLVGQPYAKPAERVCPWTARCAFWLACVAAVVGFLYWTHLLTCWYWRPVRWMLPIWLDVVSPLAFVFFWLHLLWRANPYRDAGCRRALWATLPVVVWSLLAELACCIAWSTRHYSDPEPMGTLMAVAVLDGWIPTRWAETWAGYGPPVVLILLLVPMLFLLRQLNIALRWAGGTHAVHAAE